MIDSQDRYNNEERPSVSRIDQSCQLGGKRRQCLESSYGGMPSDMHDQKVNN